MNYSSIYDAWGLDKINYDNIEHFTNINHNKNNDTKINNITCDDIINHIDNCHFCQYRMKQKFSKDENNLYKKIKFYIHENKETISVILIIIMIYLVIKLLTN
jgi:DNA-binding MltR family transcriptional regulator